MHRRVWHAGNVAQLGGHIVLAICTCSIYHFFTIAESQEFCHYLNKEWLHRGLLAGFGARKYGRGIIHSLDPEVTQIRSSLQNRILNIEELRSRSDNKRMLNENKQYAMTN
jgi:hypothetical protein